MNKMLLLLRLWTVLL